MFFTPHSLGFVLFAFLISPACTAPALERRDATEYFVKVLDVHGNAVDNPLQAVLRQSYHAIVEGGLGQRMGTPYPKIFHGPGRIELTAYEVEHMRDQLPASTMFYYELEGGTYCSPPRKCFGDLVRPENQRTGTRFTLGSLVAVKDEKIVGELKIYTRHHLDTLEHQEYVKFLVEFEPVQGVVKKMHGQSGISAAIQEAGDILHKQDKGSIAGVTGAVEKLSITSGTKH